MQKAPIKEPPRKAHRLSKHLGEFSELSSDTSERLIVKQKTIRVLLDTGSSGDLLFVAKGISKVHTYIEEGCATIVGHFKWHLYNQKGG
jgi:hypothetical protein